MTNNSPFPPESRLTPEAASAFAETMNDLAYSVRNLERFEGTFVISYHDAKVKKRAVARLSSTGGNVMLETMEDHQ